MKKDLLVLLAGFWSLGLRAQNEPEGELQWVRLPQYQLQHPVPADWKLVRQTTDTSLVITYSEETKMAFPCPLNYLATSKPSATGAATQTLAQRKAVVSFFLPDGLS